MTKEERRKLEQELENLKFLAKFHLDRGFLKGDELDDYLNALIDRVTEIQKKLNE